MKTSSPPSPFPSRVSPPPPDHLAFSAGYPLLLHWGSLVLVFAILLVAAINRILPLAALAVFILLLGLVAGLWSWRGFRHLECDLEPEVSRAFPGETVDIRFTLTNAKWLPLGWLVVGVEAPYRLVHGKRAGSPYTRERVRWAAAVGGGQRLRWRWSIPCRARGAYQLGPLRLTTGDLFGLYPREKLVPRFRELLVYPRVVPVDRLALPLTALVGDRTMPRRVYEDASRVVGARDYQPGDPFKRIHWKASARGVKLQARQYESTSSLNVVLVLDVRSFSDGGLEAEDDFELAVTATASLSNAVCQSNAPFGLVAGAEPGIQLAVASGRGQLMAVLEALARIQARAVLSLAQYLERERVEFPPGAELVLVGRGLSPELAILGRRLRAEGYGVAVVSVGREAVSLSLDGTLVIPVRHEGDLSRGPLETPT